MKTNLIYIVSVIVAVLFSTNAFAQADYVTKDTIFATSPNNIALKAYYANVESAEGTCNNEGKQFRIRGLKDGGYAEFTVPDAETVTIVLKGKSTSKDRNIKIYRDGVEIKEFSGLDVDNCATFSETIHRNAPVTYKITGGDAVSTKPVVIKSIVVEKFVSTSTGIENITVEKCQIYPNPVEDMLNINLSADMNASMIRIYSLTGSVVLEQKLSGNSSLSLQTGHLSKGIYTLQVVSDKGSIVKKIIKK